MKNIGVLLLLACLSSTALAIQPLELKRVNSSRSFRDIKYLLTLTDNQVLCSVAGDGSDGNKDRYYIKYIKNGGITYRFEDEIRLYTPCPSSGFIKDQYGAYIFLEKDGSLVLFDVKAKREYIPGEPLKRPEYIYYINKDYSKGSVERKLLKHNIVTGKIEEVYLGHLSHDELSNFDKDKLVVEDMDGNRILLYNAHFMYVLQLNESMTEVISMNERKRKDTVEYALPIDKDNYIGFKVTRSYPLDYVNSYSVLLMDRNGEIKSEDKDRDLTDNKMNLGASISDLCLVSIDKQYIMFFKYFYDSKLLKSVQDVYVYRIIYEGTLGIVSDDRVRVRMSPDLSGEILGHINRGDKVEILDVGEVQKIEFSASPWYKVRTDSNVEGWVFGVYIDITE